MGFPKGQKRGPTSIDTRNAISEGLKKRYAKQSIEWTAARDAELTQLYTTLSTKKFRHLAPRQLGVSRNCTIRRLHTLGLIKTLPVKANRSLTVPKNPSKPKPSNKISPELRQRQLDADRYAEDLLRDWTI